MLQYNETGIYTINGVKYIDLSVALKNAGYDSPVRKYVRDNKLSIADFDSVQPTEKYDIVKLTVSNGKAGRQPVAYLVTEHQLEQMGIKRAILEYNDIDGIYIINGVKYMDLDFALENANYASPAYQYVKDRKLVVADLVQSKDFLHALNYHCYVTQVRVGKTRAWKDLYLVTERQLERLALDMNSKKSAVVKKVKNNIAERAMLGKMFSSKEGWRELTAVVEQRLKEREQRTAVEAPLYEMSLDEMSLDAIYNQAKKNFEAKRLQSVHLQEKYVLEERE